MHDNLIYVAQPSLAFQSCACVLARSHKTRRFLHGASSPGKRSAAARFARKLGQLGYPFYRDIFPQTANTRGPGNPANRVIVESQDNWLHFITSQETRTHAHGVLDIRPLM